MDEKNWLKWWQTSKTQIVTKIQNLNCEKLKLCQNSKTQIVTKLKISNCEKKLSYDKSQFVTYDTLKGSFSKNILTPWQVMRFSQGSCLRFSRYFYPHSGTPLALIHFLSKFIIFFLLLFTLWIFIHYYS